MNLQKKQKRLDDRFHRKINITDEGEFFHLTGTADSWEEAVAAGLMCAKKGSRKHIVSDIKASGEAKPSPILPNLQDSALEGRKPDVLIIGGELQAAPLPEN